MERTHPSPAIKPVSQQRSQRTLQRIIDAFAMLLHTKTFEEITVAEICRAAGCSVGSFYGRVASKDDLLGHLCERSYTELIRVVASVVAPAQYEGMEFHTALEHQVRALADLHVERRGVLRAMIVHARRRPSFGEATRAFNEALVQTVVSGWHSQLEENQRAADDRTLEMAAVMAAAFLRESLIFSELWPTLEGSEVARLGDELTKMLMSYLCPAVRVGDQTRGQTA